jgi:hypothetical protein
MKILGRLTGFIPIGVELFLARETGKDRLLIAVVKDRSYEANYFRYLNHGQSFTVRCHC